MKQTLNCNFKSDLARAIGHDDHLEVEIYDPMEDKEINQEQTPQEGKRAKRIAEGADSKALKYTYEELSNYFGMPFHSAAVALDLHDTQLQRYCRKANVISWPYKKVYILHTVYYILYLDPQQR